MFKQYHAYIMGYYGMQNTGDDVLLYTTRWASQHKLGAMYNLVSSASDINCNEFGDVKALPTASFRGHHRLLHYKNALQSEKVIFGGGSVLHSEKDIQFKRHLIRLAGKKASRCVGVGIGPFNSVAAEKACAKFLNECGFIGIRDPESFAIAQDLAPNSNIKLTFDLAPLLLCNEERKVKSIERKGIMFNFCQLAIDAFGNVHEQQEQSRLDMAVQTIEQTWLQTGEPIVLLDFNGHSQFGDFHIHKKIMARVSNKVSITHIPYDPNPFKVLQRIAGFKASVSMRLHSAILSYLVNTPALSINYHKKCSSWCEQVGVPSEYQFDAQNIQPETLAQQISQGLGIGFAKPTLKPEEAVQAALLNWR
ncbi:polysaccharide pyruvyl transferase family protein [Paraglaciecola aquimarina]|uniref:Polysaccharide pyruvyl transferase family protein n=1 Tax=Paraglaciecola algarum TaxID=3050085 RepID=A0ABS9DBS8_9ALTE|nr:polysaccharide pyruvyl transferase family protein [Paraglaciecola sp. G1-23]MCF2950420.1 polysaccharide pyruvyl transferase family protein [Paraglaciecola sp. G1-23]